MGGKDKAGLLRECDSDPRGAELFVAGGRAVGREGDRERRAGDGHPVHGGGAVGRGERRDVVIAGDVAHRGGEAVAAAEGERDGGDRQHSHKMYFLKSSSSTIRIRRSRTAGPSNTMCFWG